MATNWQPYEVSIVATPADTSVGIGRSLVDSDTMPIDENHPIIDDKRENADTASVVPTKSHSPKKQMPEEQNLEVVRSEAKKKAQNEERTRIREITALCSRHSLLSLIHI